MNHLAQWRRRGIGLLVIGALAVRAATAADPPPAPEPRFLKDGCPDIALLSHPFRSEWMIEDQRSWRTDWPDPMTVELSWSAGEKEKLQRLLARKVDGRRYVVDTSRVCHDGIPKIIRIRPQVKDMPFVVGTTEMHFRAWEKPVGLLNYTPPKYPTRNGR